MTFLNTEDRDKKQTREAWELEMGPGRKAGSLPREAETSRPRGRLDIIGWDAGSDLCFDTAESRPNTMARSQALGWASFHQSKPILPDHASRTPEGLHRKWGRES